MKIEIENNNINEREFISRKHKVITEAFCQITTELVDSLFDTGNIIEMGSEEGDSNLKTYSAEELARYQFAEGLDAMLDRHQEEIKTSIMDYLRDYKRNCQNIW